MDLADTPLMTQSSGFHTPKHTLLSDVLVAHSFFGVGKQQHSVSLSDK